MKDVVDATLSMCGYHEMRDGEPNPACERCAEKRPSGNKTGEN
jgi:hypothetical protein